MFKLIYYFIYYQIVINMEHSHKTKAEAEKLKGNNLMKESKY